MIRRLPFSISLVVFFALLAGLQLGSPSSVTAGLFGKKKKSNSSEQSKVGGSSNNNWKGGTLARHAASLNLTQDFIPKGQFARKLHRPIRPKYITVHSTYTFQSHANAAHFGRALRKGYLTATHNLIGYLSWHFSVDQAAVVQHLPTNERGEHADYEGPGNKTSIGIEMCENKGNSRERTLQRTAQLVAALMKDHGIPLRNVVPHYHWERIRPKTGKNLGHKSCPHFLMEKDGKPGAKWNAFLSQVKTEFGKL